MRIEDATTKHMILWDIYDDNDKHRATVPPSGMHPGKWYCLNNYGNDSWHGSFLDAIVRAQEICDAQLPTK